MGQAPERPGPQPARLVVQRNGSAVVDLEMSYEPAGLLATLAAPVLVVDNFLALNVLLQSAVRRRRP